MVKPPAVPPGSAHRPTAHGAKPPPSVASPADGVAPEGGRDEPSAPERPSTTCSVGNVSPFHIWGRRPATCPNCQCTLHTDRRYARTNYPRGEERASKDSGRRHPDLSPVWSTGWQRPPDPKPPRPPQGAPREVLRPTGAPPGHFQFSQNRSPANRRPFRREFQDGKQRF